MIWDFINTAISFVSATIAGIEAVLPPNPIYLTSSDVAAVASVAGYAAFFLPISAMVVTFAGFVSVLISWVTVLLFKQLVEAVIP